MYKVNGDRSVGPLGRRIIRYVNWQGGEMKKQYEADIKRHIRLGYCEYLPTGYDSNAARKWPLVIALHGIGERGNDLALVTKHGMARYAEEGKDYPFVLIAPQCPQGTYWGAMIETLNDFLDYLLTAYNVDERRVYLTGLSMGGNGTWTWALAHPERFAAIAPVCGSGVCWYCDNLANVPVWAFHGAEDQTIPCTESRAMVEGINNSGGNAKLTIYDGVGHNCWELAYSGDSLANWLLQHRRP